MRKLKLNFNELPNPPSSAARWVLLLIGLALLAEMLMSNNKLQHEHAAINKEIVTYKIQIGAPRHESFKQQYSDADFDEASKIIKRLSAPWESFFVSLESISNKNIAILVIEPDVQAGLLRLEGEAKDYPSVLTFISQLSGTQPFSKVFLLHHEYKSADPQHPVIFSISMSWIESK